MGLGGRVSAGRSSGRCALALILATLAAPAIVRAAGPPAAPPATEAPPLPVSGTQLRRPIGGGSHRVTGDSVPRVPGAAAAQAHAPGRAAGADPDRDFWAWDFQEQRFYRLRAHGIHFSNSVEIYVEEGLNLPGPVINRLATAFEDQIRPRLHEAIGTEPIPGIDAKPALTLLLLDIRDAFYHQGDPSTFISGYFDPVNQMREADLPAGQHSNETEMVYIDAAPPTDPQAQRFLQTVAHEFTHLIHWNLDPNEARWFDEGLSQLGVFLAGLGHPRQHVEEFLRQPQVSLTYWSGTPRDYGKVYLFFLYLHDRFGDPEGEWLRGLAASPGIDMAGLAARLPAEAPPAAVFRDFALALALDSPQPGEGRLGFRSIRLGSGGDFPLAQPHAHPADPRLSEEFLLGPWTARVDRLTLRARPANLSLAVDSRGPVCLGLAWGSQAGAARPSPDRLETPCLTEGDHADWVFEAPPAGGSTEILTVVANPNESPLAAEIVVADLAVHDGGSRAYLPLALRR